MNPVPYIDGLWTLLYQGQHPYHSTFCFAWSVGLHQRLRQAFARAFIFRPANRPIHVKSGLPDLRDNIIGLLEQRLGVFEVVYTPTAVCLHGIKQGAGLIHKFLQFLAGVPICE